MCRSRRELSNEYLLAKISVNTAENEPLEVWGKFIQYYSFVSLLVPGELDLHGAPTEDRKLDRNLCPLPSDKGEDERRMLHVGRENLGESIP